MTVPTPQSRAEQYLSVIAGHEGETPNEPASRIEYFLNEIVENGGTGSGGEGSANYNSLINKPKISGVSLIGNKTAADLGLASTEDVSGALGLKVDKVTGKGLSTNDYTDTEKTKLAGIPADATNNAGTVTSITISGTAPIFVSDDEAVTTSGERVISHADSGVTAGSKGDTSAQTPAFGGTFKVLSVTVDTKGHITAFEEHTVEIPSDTATQSAAGLMSAEDKTKLDVAVTGVKGDKESSYRNGNVNVTPSNIGAVPTLAIGVANGVAELDANGKVPSAQLPAYVDDVLEYANRAAFPVTGETGKIYVAIDTNLTYRWSGSAYIEISPSLSLGETSSTAYRGDRGKVAYDHSQTTGNAHGMTKADIGLGNVDNTSDANKPVSTAQQTALNSKVDKVTGKGLSTNDYTTAEKSKLSGIEAQANKSPCRKRLHHK